MNSTKDNTGLTTLITGGAGFIGSHLAATLLQQDEPVILLDNLDDYYDPNIKKERLKTLAKDAKFIEGDIRDVDGIENMLRVCFAFFSLGISSFLKFQCNGSQGLIITGLNLD